MTLFRKDFLTRQIQYLTQILQEIIFKKNQNQQQEAIEKIDQLKEDLRHSSQIDEINNILAS